MLGLDRREEDWELEVLRVLDYGLPNLVLLRVESDQFAQFRDEVRQLLVGGCRSLDLEIESDRVLQARRPFL